MMRTLLLLLALSLPAFPSETSWLWVHAGVAMQIGGNFADITTSWQQPEATKWLATNGRFERQRITAKLSLSAGISVASYLIASKWPRSRKYVGIINLSIGGTWGAVANSNYTRNPYFR